MSPQELRDWFPLVLIVGLGIALFNQIGHSANPLNIAWMVVVLVGAAVYWATRIRKPNNDDHDEEEENK